MTPELYRSCKRYGVLHKVDELLMTMSQGMSIVKWKLFVNKLVIEEVTMTWSTRRYMYRSLELYNECVVNMNVSVCWKVLNAIPTLAKKIMKMLQLICQGKFVRPNRATYEHLKRCQLCNRHDLGNVCHVLFECTELSAVRTPLLVTVYRCMPAAMNDCFKMFSNRQKTVFLSSGLKCEFVEEWADIYKSIVYFIAEMYTAYFIELN